jgi:hypothetical protein
MFLKTVLLGFIMKLNKKTPLELRDTIFATEADIPENYNYRNYNSFLNTNKVSSNNKKNSTGFDERYNGTDSNTTIAELSLNLKRYELLKILLHDNSSINTKISKLNEFNSDYVEKKNGLVLDSAGLFDDWDFTLE